LENVIEGAKYSVKNIEYVAGDDELIIPEFEKGNTKVDAEGRLLGGREYKLRTFTSATRKNPERVYALTIDAARACGYTDSLAFLRRCPQIVKLSCGEEERQMLIDVGRITGNLKHRMVTMVAMRNVYKLMGARLVQSEY
jgi:chromatin structure-remodeling complex protein RSC7